MLVPWLIFSWFCDNLSPFSSSYTAQCCETRRQTTPLVWSHFEAAAATAAAAIRLPASICRTGGAAFWLLVIMYELSIR